MTATPRTSVGSHEFVFRGTPPNDGRHGQFVPLSVIAYSQLKPSQNNKASSLTNFFRNWGGSFGIAFITTMSERRSDFHQLTVGSNLPPSSTTLQQQVNQGTAYLQAHGFSHADALNAAYSHYYSQLQAQAHFLAFMDCFHLIGLVTLIAAPLVLLSKYFRIGGSAPSGH
jgi:MFS transporter, DHA2 family, multidrug resistance protein